MTNTNNPHNPSNRGQGCFRSILLGIMTAVVLPVIGTVIVKLIDNGTINIPGLDLSRIPFINISTRQNYELTGLWEADVTEFGKSFQVIWVIKSDNTSSVQFVIDNQVQLPATYSWQYSGDTLIETDSFGNERKSRLAWKDKDHFEQTILEDQRDDYKGLKRSFHRR